MSSTPKSRIVADQQVSMLKICWLNGEEFERSDSNKEADIISIFNSIVKLIDLLYYQSR